MPIKVLPPEVTSKIAAGEVIERPSSVAKELIENSLDAGAREIVVEAHNGGVSYLRVADNGSGLSAADVEVAVKRHATSKITKLDDLEHISTLGF
ncbi:MAG: ATP-binding protein, partial [Dehalococcoidia bacterium]